MQHESVLEMVSNVGEDKEFVDILIKRFGAKRILKRLTAIRAFKGLSAREVAQKLGWSVETFSNVESMEDKEVRLGVMEDYANILGFKLEVTLSPKES